MIEVLRSWSGGPFREFADVRPTPSWGGPYDGKLPYAGSYICEACGGRCTGVYIASQFMGSSPVGIDKKWVCGPCKDAGKPKREQPKRFKK